MAVKSAEARTAKWYRRCTPERVEKTFSEDRELMRENVAAAFASLAYYEQMAKTELAWIDTSVIFYTQYLNYVRQLWKIIRRFQGNPLKREAFAVLTKWRLRGLDAAVMRRLALKVFTLDVPAEM